MDAHEMQITKKKFRMKKRLLAATGVAAAVFLSFFLLAGPVIRMLYGVRNPTVETAQSLLQTARKYQLETSNIVTVSPAGRAALMKLFGGIPEALIYNKEGQRIAYKEIGKECNAGLFSFIPLMAKNGNYKTLNETKLTEHMGQLRDLNGRPLPENYLDTTADYYILISWAAFTGELNRNHVKKWQELARQNRNAKIQVIAVNVDIQQWWPDDAKERALKR